MGTPRTCDGSLCCAGNYRPDEVNAVNSYRDAEDRRDFTRQWRAAQSFGARTDQDGRATLALRRKRKSKFQTGACRDGDIGVEKDPGTGDVSQLPSVELQRAVLGHTHLYGQVNLVASSLSALSHNIPPELDARRRPGEARLVLLIARRLQPCDRFQSGNDNANSSRYRKYRHALVKFVYLFGTPARRQCCGFWMEKLQGSGSRGRQWMDEFRSCNGERQSRFAGSAFPGIALWRDLENRIVKNRGAFGFGQNAFADHQVDQAH